MGLGSGRSSNSEEHHSSAEEDTACTDHPQQGALAEHRQHGQVLSAGNRCQRLERVLEQCPCGKEELDPQPEEEPTDLASALASLEAERKSRREVMQLNVVLREHLEITTRTNEELTREVRDLTEEWQQHGPVPVVSQWQQDLEKLRGDLGQLRQAVLVDLSGLGGALARLRRECTPLSADRWELCREIAGDLNQQVDSLNAENDGLQQALDKATRLTKELSQQLDDRVAQVERLEGQLCQLRAELGQAQQQGQLKEEALGSSERELQSLREALRRTQELHDQLHTQHTGVQQAFSERLEQQTRECTDRLESLLRQSEARQGELRQQLGQEKQELLDAQAALAEARAHGDALGRELVAVREQLSSSCREREEQAQALAQCEARLSAAQEDRQGQLRTQRAALEEQLRRAQGQADRQAQACQQARTDLRALQERLSEEQRAHQEALAGHEREAGRARAEHERELRRLREEHEGALGRLLDQQGHVRQELSERLREQTEACAALEERLRSQGEAFRNEAAQLQALQLKAQAAREAERQLLAQGLAACREQVRALGHQQAALQADTLRMLQQQPGSTTVIRDVLRRLGQAEQSWEEQQRQADQHTTRLQLQLQEAARRSSQLESEQKVAAQRLADIRQSRDEVLAEREQLHQLVAELQRDLDRAVADKEAALQDSARMFREAEAVRAQLATECGRLRAEHQEELQAQRSQAEATLLRESSFWKAKVSLCESEARAGRLEREQLEAQLGQLRECLSDERQAHQAQARALQQQRADEQAQAQRRLLHEGQALHRSRLALSAAQGRLSALEAHLGALAETRQRSEAVLCSLLSALRCALGVAPPPQDGTGAEEVEQEEQQLVVAAVQGLVSRVAALAKEKETLEAEADRWGREQRSLRAQLASSAEELQRATAARDRLSAENEHLLEEASRLRLQLQELGWERASLGDQLHEATRRLELLQRLQAASSEPVLDRRLSEQQLAEVQLAEARLDQLKRRLDHQAAERSRAEAAAAAGAPPPGAHKVQRLQAQLEAERLRSERLSERERALEAQLREALARAHALATEGQRLRAEREALQREKDTLETKFSAVAVQLAESEAAKQRLHQRQRSGAASRDDSLRRENERLEKELGRVRQQLSRTVDVMFAQPRTSTPKPPREAPEGDSLAPAQGPAPPAFVQRQLEAHLHTSLKVELSRSHQEGDHSFQQGRGDGLSAELERSLQAVAERPDRLRSESRRLERAIGETLPPPSPPSASHSAQGLG